MNCGVCGQPTPEAEMIHFEGRWICAACKPAYMQQLKEGADTPLDRLMIEGFDERVLGFGRLVQLTWSVLRQEWLPICGMVLLVSIPMELVLVSKIVPFEPNTFEGIYAQICLAGLLQIFIGTLRSLGVAKVVSERMEGRRIGFSGALRHAVRRWLAGIGTSFLASFITGLLTLCLVVPGIIWMGYYSFAMAITSLRNTAGSDALEDSKFLVKGRWWSIVGRLIGLGVISLLPMIPIQIAMAFVPHSDVLVYVIRLLSNLCYAFPAVGTTLLFLNLDVLRQRGLPR